MVMAGPERRSTEGTDREENRKINEDRSGIKVRRARRLEEKAQRKRQVVKKQGELRRGEGEGAHAKRHRGTGGKKVIDIKTRIFIFLSFFLLSFAEREESRGKKKLKGGQGTREEKSHTL